MDILSGVMRLLRTEGHVYGRMELSGRFGLKFPNENQNGICLLVTRGSCFLNIDGGKLVPLVAGDFVFFPRWKTGYLRSDKNIVANKTVSAEQMAQLRVTKRFAHDSGGGAPVSLICGCFTFSSPESHLLVEQLPKVMHLKCDDIGPWTRALFQLMNVEIVQEQRKRHA